jgi:AcrR family transcriptional regulator
MLAGLGRIRAPSTYAEMIRNLLLGFLDLLQEDDLLRQALAWELAGPSPAATRLAAARGTVMAEWLGSVRGTLTPPDGVDAPAINALLIGSVQQMVLSLAASGGFVGVPADAAGQSRLRAAAVQLVAGVYGP